MTVLGISLGFNSSASLWEDGKCLASISEERINGIRNTKDLPIEAARTCIEVGRCSNTSNIVLAYSFYEDLSNDYLAQHLNNKQGFNSNKSPIENLKNILIENLDIGISRVERVEHHLAHAYSAYAVYGIHDDYTTLTMDGFGDGISARLIVNGEIKAELPLVKSFALYYQFVTGALGFKEHQHEGKVTGLSTDARLVYDQDTYEKVFMFFRRLYEDIEPLEELSEEEKTLFYNSHIVGFDKFLRLKKTIYNFVKSIIPSNLELKDSSSENYITKNLEAVAIAKAVQDFVVEGVCKFIATYNNGNITEHLYLAGGMFANVSLNRKIGERFRYKHIYISPAMGDEGTAMGAAALQFKANLLEFHPDYIIPAGIPIIYDNYHELTEKEIAATICTAIDGVLHYCSGRSEFGPRALMRRSSLFSAVDKEKTLELNKAMQRSEFMPYAPVCCEESMDILFEEGYEKYEESLQFMTVALKALPWVKEKYPGAVHSDGTCRVQVLHKDIPCERKAWDIVHEYTKLTGELLLINTSYNIHNKPTSASYKQCLDTHKQSGYFGTLYMEEF